MNENPALQRAMDLSSMTQTEKIILGCCAASAVLALLPWFSVSFEGPMQHMAEMGGGSFNAFGVAEGVLAFLAILATAGLLLADRAGVLKWQPKNRLLAPLIGSAAAVLLMLIFMTRGGSVNMMGVSSGRTIWFYLALLAMAFATFQAFQRWGAGTGRANPPPDPTHTAPPPPPATGS